MPRPGKPSGAGPLRAHGARVLLVRGRGLKQAPSGELLPRGAGLQQGSEEGPGQEPILRLVPLQSPDLEPVSYTHLTLPTICSV
eukprot:1747185-Alexandrium_andersonii.AAC.1